MCKGSVRWLLGALAGLVPFVVAPRAEADGLASCGDIHVEANAQCTAEVTGGCDVYCEDLSYSAACWGKGSVECDGQCSGSVSADCDTSCSASCQGECDVDPGAFDCSASCETTCSGHCDADCSGSSDSASCRASCEGSCKADCKASCDVEPPTATCEAKCSASCTGQCHAKAEVNCNVECQSNLSVSCEATLKGGCVANCSQPHGVVACDGQYVDQGNNGEECLDALSALVGEVNGYASASGSCDNGKCEAKADAGVSCAMAPASNSTNRPALVLGIVGLGLGAWARRRQTRA